jgi:hypothetical protein
MTKNKASAPVPYHSFHGWLKCQRAYHRNALGTLVANTAFPLFSPDLYDGENSDIDNLMEDVARKQGIEIQKRPAVRFRRFAGDRKGAILLDRSRYYTVCRNEMGADSGTLANEFNAYCDTNKVGFAWTVDMAEADPPQKAVAIFLNDLEGAPSPTLAQAREQGLLPPDANAVRVDIPYDVTEHTIEKVLDLRYPDARQWLFDEFGSGKPGVVEREAPPPPPEATFINMLPWLMIRDNGGDGLTNAIGSYLRTIGVEALIFPSARSDTYVEFRNGELVDFGGWNLVDYRNATIETEDETLLLFGDWTGFRDRSAHGLVDWTTTIRLPPDGSEYEGSFRIEGNQSHHMLLLHIPLCFRIWDEVGLDTPVKAYRWHSTRAVQQPEGLIFLATCLECGHELPPIDTIEGFHAIENACPACGNMNIHIP